MSPGRRSLMKLIAGGIGLIPAYLSYRVLIDFFHSSSSVNTARIFLGTVKDVTNRLEAGRASYYLDDKKKILVIQDGKAPGESGISVYSLICTHLGCTLRPGKDNLFLECPCHGSKFHFLEPFKAHSACGQVSQGPATNNLKRYNVVIIKNKIYLES